MPYSEYDTARRVQVDTGTNKRSHFERDRARLIHCAALRRLGTKTQVMGANYDDFVRTRLTHSLEVAQIGRDLAIQIGADPNVVDAACLAHDLGHPPFGHNGEVALNEIASDIGGFEGNAQTLRIITRLEAKVFADLEGSGVEQSYGLNLTRAVLDATCKYPWKRSQTEAITGKKNYNKFGVYEDDEPYFLWMRGSAPLGKKCIEAQIMDLADDISYCTHDIEDAIVTGVMGQPSLAFILEPSKWQHLLEVNDVWYPGSYTADDLANAAERLKSAGLLDIAYNGTRKSQAAIKNMTSALIGRCCEPVCEATISAYSNVNRVRYNADLVIPSDTAVEIHLLKVVSAAFMMNPRNQTSSYQGERDLIYRLAERFQSRPQLLEPQFLEDYQTASDEATKLRVIVDQIACLTDVSAKRLNASVLM